MTKDFLEGLLEAQKAINRKIRGAQLSQVPDLGFMNLDRSHITDFSIINSRVCLSAAGAFLAGAFFRGVHFKEGTSFREADLRNAEFMDCTLTGEESAFVGSNLYGTRFTRCKMPLAEYRKGKVVTEDIIAYKICRMTRNIFSDFALVTLKIPRGAIVFSINGNKCRTNKAIVTKITAAEGGEKLDRAFSTHKYFSYYVGDEITVYDFNCEYNVECGEGIHFFMTQKEALNYAGIY